MQVTIKEFNEIINAGVDDKVKAALRDFAANRDTSGFELDRIAAEIEQAFMYAMVDQYRTDAPEQRPLG